MIYKNDFQIVLIFMTLKNVIFKSFKSLKKPLNNKKNANYIVLYLYGKMNYNKLYYLKVE